MLTACAQKQLFTRCAPSSRSKPGSIMTWQMSYSIRRRRQRYRWKTAHYPRKKQHLKLPLRKIGSPPTTSTKVIKTPKYCYSRILTGSFGAAVIYRLMLQNAVNPNLKVALRTYFKVVQLVFETV